LIEATGHQGEDARDSKVIFIPTRRRFLAQSPRQIQAKRKTGRRGRIRERGKKPKIGSEERRNENVDIGTDDDRRWRAT
jgi:hypothetical protein